MKTINVCIGSACHLKGAYNVVNHLQRLIKEEGLMDKVAIKAAFCLGECTKAVSVRVDSGPVISVEDGKEKVFFDEHIIGRL